MFDQGILEWFSQNAGLVVSVVVAVGGLLFFLFGIFGDPEKRTSLTVFSRQLFSIPPVKQKASYILIVVGLIMAVGGLWLFSKNWPPTPTPTPTPTQPPAVAVSPTPEPPSPIPEVSVTPCSVDPGSRFASLWADVRDRLGCPTNEARSTNGAAQLFENGSMLWREDLDTIYVMYDNRNLSSYGPSFAFREDEDPESRELPAPPGLQEPRRGFGKIWYEELDGPDAEIGWALEPEYALSPPDLEIQDFDRGVMFWSYRFGTRVLFLDDKTWQ